MIQALLYGEACELTAAVAAGCRVALGQNASLDVVSDSVTLEQQLRDVAPDVALYLAATQQGWAPAVEFAGEIIRRLLSVPLRQFVLVSSAAIEAPRPVHPGMVKERARPPRGIDPVADAWAALENLAASACEASECELVILRPAAMPSATTADPLGKIARRRLVPTAAGHDPPIQLLAPQDLGRALAEVIVIRTNGIFHVAPSGVVPLHDAIRRRRGMCIPLPMWTLRGIQLLKRAVGGAPAATVERLRYTATVSGERLQRETGFVPEFSSAEVARGDHAARETALPPIPAYDDFGQNPKYVALLRKTILRFLHEAYWRVDIAGTENIPASGPAVLTGMHRGFMPFDGTMALYGVARETDRFIRFLIHPSLVKMPFLADFIRRQGGLMACRENADRMLQDGELLGVFPEGIDGAFSYYRDAYILRRDFGRNEYVKAALRNRSPIVPFVTVGSPEIFPILAKIEWPWWQRLTAWPCFPLAPPFPVAPVPLPSKWHTRFLEAIPVHEDHPPEAASDRRIVDEIDATVRRRMQRAVDEMLSRRRHVFYGSLAEETQGAYH